MIFLPTEVHKNTEFIWLAATIYQSSAGSCWTTTRAWCFPVWAPECWATATLETKSKQTTDDQDQKQSDNLWPGTLYQPWKWNKIKFQLSSPLPSPHYMLHDWKEQTQKTKISQSAQSMPAALECYLWLISHHWCIVDSVTLLWLLYDSTLTVPLVLILKCFLILCSCVCVGAMTHQTCLETPGDICSRKSIHCTQIWGRPLAEWLPTETLAAHWTVYGC